jgi:hypothetical protein
MLELVPVVMTLIMVWTLTPLLLMMTLMMLMGRLVQVLIAALPLRPEPPVPLASE